MVDVGTVVVSGGASLGLLGILWKLINDRIDAKQEKCVCDERHKTLDKMDEKLDTLIVTVAKIETKVKGESS